MTKKKAKKKPFIILGYILLIIGLGVYIYLTPNKDVKPSKKPTENKKEEKKPVKENFSFSFIGAGDALIHTGVYVDAKTGAIGADGYAVYGRRRSIFGRCPGKLFGLLVDWRCCAAESWRGSDRILAGLAQTHRNLDRRYCRSRCGSGGTVPAAASALCPG